MNSYTLFLSSSGTSYIKSNSELNFDDHTLLTLSVSALNEKVLPIYLQIDWGFGNVLTYDNNIYESGNPIYKFSPILTNTYSYEYYPSSTAMYKSLSAQILVRYSNGDYTWFVIPIRIRSYDYSESIKDLDLINTNILPNDSNTSEHQLKTSEGGFIIELRGD